MKPRNRLCLWALAAIVGCTSQPPSVVYDGDADTGDAGPLFDNGPQRCTVGAILCSGNRRYECGADGEAVAAMDCPAGTLCFAGLGCRVCMPGLSRCGITAGREQQVESCRADGGGWNPGPTCDTAQGMACTGGRCASRCDEAALGRSYLGCDYWATVTPNSQLGTAFDFAVVLSNPQTYPVQASITGGGLTTPRQLTLAPGAIETVSLPWVQELVQRNTAFVGCRRPGDPACLGANPARSALRRNGAYHVRANGPIAAYQFNPLTYQSPAGLASFTNDASLLLPQGVLTQRYTVSTYPNWGARSATGTIYLGGFAAIVAVTGESTTVTVRPTAQIAVGEGVAPIPPGSQASFTLQPGDVLELVGTGAGDLTGTAITSDLPVAVFVGHDCTNVPGARPACDHLEEQLFPNETWGRDYFVSALRDRTMPNPDGSTSPLPSVVRVVSQANNNRLTYDPPGVRPSETLNAGQVLEFAATQSFRVTGTQAFLVSQFMIGQGDATSTASAGDPAMVFEVPVQQYRTSYDFYVPATYPQNFINVVTPQGTTLTMDGAPLRGTSETVSGYTVLTLPITSGPHRLRGDTGQQFGIKLYGIAPYTSYMYPGGLDLRLITPG
jgi:hypothetical protein